MQPHSTLSDSELVDYLRSGDKAAFTEIYNRHWQSAYRSAFNVLKDDEACLDVVQDVFVWLWQNREQLSIISLKPYLITAVKFKMLNVIRQGKFRAEIIAELGFDKEGLTFAESSLEVKELKAIIDQFVEDLPAQAQKIFHLSRNEHLSHKEIAQQMGLSEKTVKNQMNISLKKLRTSLGRMNFWMCFFF